MNKENWFTTGGNFWRFRAILEINRKGKRRLDFVPDRGGFFDNQRTEDRVAFLNDILDSKQWDAWLQMQQGNSTDVFVYGRDGMNFRATPNASYGYLYMWAWED